MIRKVLLFTLLLAAAFYGCSDHTVATIETGTVQGTVVKNNSPVANAYIFWEDSLMATTDANGNYQIMDLEEGSQELLCSALFAKDTTMQVSIEANKTNTINFTLTHDETIGRVYGEFQDVPLFNAQLSEVSGLDNWSAKEVYEGTTGATICVKWLDVTSTESIVSLGDSILGYDDGWGQYLLKMQVGTYPLTGSSIGYQSKTHVVTVVPDEKTYCNFYLNRE